MRRFVFGLLVGMTMALSVSAQSLMILCENDPPVQFRDANGNLTGYTVELVREIQRRVGNQDEIKMLPWARAYDMIQKYPNVVLFQMSRSAEREKLFNWVGPVQEHIYGLYAKADSKITLSSLEEAKKVRSIGVYRGDIRHQILAEAGFTNLVVANENSANIAQLMRGRVDLITLASTTYDREVSSAGFSPSDLKLVLPFHTSRNYLAMSKEMPPKVVESWNAALEAMRKDGSIDKLIGKYFPK